MIVFFDTNVHVDLMRGRLRVDDLEPHLPGPTRMSPVVASELLRAAHGAVHREVETLIARLRPIEPPSWRSAFLAAGRLLRTIGPDHDDVGLARLQNDVLLALTAHHAGARLLTRDRHFASLRERLPFDCIVLP
ncbi:MAG: type II toxin-antitoxin system VapC family toxin [Planctomycetes bacterium]|nr:type II toxin-antitoxin system VapC family toxin [Planctomycetota bacterium]